MIGGTVYLWGNMNDYIASYLRHNGNPDITIEKVNFVFPFMALALTAATPFGIRIADRIGIKLHSFICAILMAAALFIISYVKDFWIFAIAYGLLFGIPTGLIYSCAFNVAY